MAPRLTVSKADEPQTHADKVMGQPWSQKAKQEQVPSRRDIVGTPDQGQSQPPTQAGKESVHEVSQSMTF